MELLIYSFAIDGTIIRLVKNSLGYCLHVITDFHTNIFITTTIDESLLVMQYLMSLFH